MSSFKKLTCKGTLRQEFICLRHRQFSIKNLFPLLTANWIGDYFDNKRCGSNKSCLLITHHLIFGAYKETRPEQEKIRGFMIHAANSVRIAIDAGNFYASLCHCLHRIPWCQSNRLFILLERAETEIRFSMANGMFKIKMDIDRHCPRHVD